MGRPFSPGPSPPRLEGSVPCPLRMSRPPGPAAASPLSSPATAQKMLAAGIDLTPSTPEEMAERIRIDLPLWAKIVRDAGIEPE